MTGTIYSGTYVNGIVLSSPATQNPATVTATGKVSSNGVALFGAAGTAWTVSNFGTVEGIGTAGNGIYLTAGGSVTNSPNGVISGSRNGVVVGHAIGAVVNAGTIEGAGTASGGIYLTAGGSVTNNPNSVISGSINGVTVGHATGTVVNSGTIEGIGPASGGIYLVDGGRVANRSGGLVTGGIRGITIGHSPGNVENLGTIAGTGTSGGGIWLISGGSVGNGASGSTAALIESAATAIAIGSTAGGSGTVTNYGTIKAATGEGVFLVAGGTVSNFGTIENSGTANFGVVIAKGAVINGSSAATKALIAGVGGVLLSGTAATGAVTNFGTVTATTDPAVILEGGGTVGNFGAIESAWLGAGIRGVAGAIANFGTIISTNTTKAGAVWLAKGGVFTNGSSGSAAALITSERFGVYIGGNLGTRYAGAVGTVTNFGTIETTGTQSAVLLVAGGTVRNFGAIAGYRGIHFESAAGTVTNYGTIKGTTAKGTAATGVTLDAGGTVGNLGTIESSAGDGVFLAGGGHVNNGTGSKTTALIKGGIGGVAVEGAAATITNFGTIAGSGSASPTPTLGVTLDAGGTVTNRGLVAGGSYGIAFGTTASAGTVVNSGTVTGKLGFAVVVGNNAGNALINSGRIAGTGGTAVAFGGGNDVLTVEPGAVFVGAVEGGKGTDKVIEGVHGALNVTGFSGFETIRLANGGADSLTLDNANFAGVTGASITIVGGNAGNTVDAAGLTGADRIVAVGGAGKDVFTGGAGNDFFYFAEPNLAATDIVKGGGGSDTLVVTTAGIVHAAGVSGVEIYRLGNGGADTLALTDANFAGVSHASPAPTSPATIAVFDSNAGNRVSAAGVAASDRIVVHAGAGADKLVGGAGNDLFYAARDTTMTGGLGANVFELTSHGPDTDTITDFGNPAAANHILLADAAFGLTGSGPLPPGLFTSNPTGAFTAATQRFAYDTSDGSLYYSASGASADEHLIVTLIGHPTLTAADFTHG